MSNNPTIQYTSSQAYPVQANQVIYRPYNPNEIPVTSYTVRESVPIQEVRYTAATTDNLQSRPSSIVFQPRAQSVAFTTPIVTDFPPTRLVGYEANKEPYTYTPVPYPTTTTTTTYVQRGETVKSSAPVHKVVQPTYVSTSSYQPEVIQYSAPVQNIVYTQPQYVPQVVEYQTPQYKVIEERSYSPVRTQPYVANTQPRGETAKSSAVSHTPTTYTAPVSYTVPSYEYKPATYSYLIPVQTEVKEPPVTYNYQVVTKAEPTKEKKSAASPERKSASPTKVIFDTNVSTTASDILCFKPQIEAIAYSPKEKAPLNEFKSARDPTLKTDNHEVKKSTGQPHAQSSGSINTYQPTPYVYTPPVSTYSIPQATTYEVYKTSTTYTPATTVSNTSYSPSQYKPMTYSYTPSSTTYTYTPPVATSTTNLSYSYTNPGNTSSNTYTSSTPYNFSTANNSIPSGTTPANTTTTTTNTYSPSAKPNTSNPQTTQSSKPIPVPKIEKDGDHKSQNYQIVTIKNDYGDVKQAKEIADDPNSKFNQLWKQLKSTRQKFSDPEFPPNVKSLGKSDTYNVQDIIWCRPDQYYGKGKYNLYEGSISVDDIKQGSLGDCYFLCTLAALAEWPHRIEKLFVNKEANEEGIYSVRINDMGEWQEVIIDDQLPCWADDRTLAFAKGNGNELWVCLLEKAWAKLFGSYARIEAGDTREALHDLTGAPTRFFYLADLDPQGKEHLWSELLHGEKNDFVMTCSSPCADGLSDQDDRDGIFYGHAYSLLSAHEVHYQGRPLRLLRIRNPHSHGEWTGAWSDESPLWTQEVKSQVQWTDADDGTFYMSWDDFFEYYEDCQICKVHDDYHYTSLKVPSTGPNENIYFKITIPQDGKFYVTINQENKRHHDEMEQYQHSPVYLLLAKLTGSTFQEIEQKNETGREVWTDGHLKAGEYYAYVQIDWLDGRNHPIVISAYGPEDVPIKKISGSDNPKFIDFYDDFIKVKQLTR